MKQVAPIWEVRAVGWRISGLFHCVSSVVCQDFRIQSLHYFWPHGYFRTNCRANEGNTAWDPASPLPVSQRKGASLSKLINIFLRVSLFIFPNLLPTSAVQAEELWSKCQEEVLLVLCLSAWIYINLPHLPNICCYFYVTVTDKSPLPSL